MRFYVLTGILLLVATLHAQSQNKKSIEYDFSTKELKGNVPYDQPFEIKCTNLLDSVRNLRAIIYMINRGKYKGPYNKGKPLTDEMLLNDSNICKIFYQTSKLTRNNQFNGAEAVIPIQIFLLPNTSYFIRITGETKKTALKGKEKDEAVKTILEYKSYKDKINGIIANQMLNETSSESWSEDFEVVNRISNEAVKTFDENYMVSDINYEDQFTTYLNLVKNSLLFRVNLRNYALGYYAAVIQRLTDEKNADPVVIQKTKEIDSINEAIGKYKEEQRVSKDQKGIEASKQKLDKANAALKAAKTEVKEIMPIISKGIEKANTIYSELKNSKSVEKILPAVANRLRQIDWLNDDLTTLDFKKEFSQDMKKMEIEGLLPAISDSIAIVKATELQTKKLDAFKDSLATAMDQFKEHLIIELEKSIFSYSNIGNTYAATLQERFKMHVTLDLGYAYVANVDRFNLYTGMNIYMRAIDTSLPLNSYHHGKFFRDFIGSRTSLLLGVSLQSIKKEGIRKGIVSDDMALISGIGFRLLSFLKINGGAYFFYALPSDPLVNKSNYHVKAAPFVSFSIDFNLGSFLQSFGNGQIAKIFTQ